MKRNFEKMKYRQLLLSNSAHTHYNTASANTNFSFPLLFIYFFSFFFSKSFVKSYMKHQFSA